MPKLKILSRKERDISLHSEVYLRHKIPTCLISVIKLNTHHQSKSLFFLAHSAHKPALHIALTSYQLKLHYSAQSLHQPFPPNITTPKHSLATGCALCPFYSPSPFNIAYSQSALLARPPFDFNTAYCQSSLSIYPPSPFNTAYCQSVLSF